MFKRLWVGLVLATVLVAGCGSATKEAPAKRAETVAVDFYRSWFLAGDVGRAWDLAAPDLWTAQSRGEFVDYQLKLRADTLKLLPADSALRVQTFDRADDYLFLVSDPQKQHMIWVTKLGDGWKVRRFEDYREGMGIPW